MTWWLMPAIIGVVVAAIAIGLLISYVILKRQKRPFPFFQKSREGEAGQKTAELPGPIDPVPEALPKKSYQSAALLELEHDLAIATAPMTKDLMKYRTDMWNTRRSYFTVLDPELLGELTEVYVDMILANNVLGMSAEPDKNNRSSIDRYAKLSAKIAERLNRIMPDLREKLD